MRIQIVAVLFFVFASSLLAGVAFANGNCYLGGSRLLDADPDIDITNLSTSCPCVVSGIFDYSGTLAWRIQSDSAGVLTVENSGTGPIFASFPSNQLPLGGWALDCGKAVTFNFQIFDPFDGAGGSWITIGKIMQSCSSTACE